MFFFCRFALPEMKKSVYVALLFVIVLSSCNDKPFFEKEHDFPGDTWKRFDFTVFEVPVNKGDILDFSLTVKYYKKFGETLPLNITLYTPEGEMRSRDYNINLNRGKIKREEVQGTSVYTKTFSIHKGIKFYKKGKCKIRIEQKLSKYETEGIKSITLKAVKSKN
jgi:gliding motility-associated lipoprotein GldH